MVSLGGGGGAPEWTFKMLVFSMAVIFLLPTFITIYCPTMQVDSDVQDDLFDTYYEMTGQQAQTKTSIWILTGLYTPVEEGSPHLVTPDGWMARSELKTWTPSQYVGSPSQYTVQKGSDGYFRYVALAGGDGTAATQDFDADTGTGHYAGELYTAFNFDPQYMSDIFFTETQRTETDDGFYYQYSGVRAAFQPISSYTVQDADGERIPVIATTTSLSLVWYQWYNQGNGITGQLIISGSNGGVGFITGSTIVSAFNSATNSATIPMVFNGGVQMDLIFRLDPFYLSTMTVQECYDAGYWSILVTSQSVDDSAYTGTDNTFNPIKIFETMVNLFTFNYSSYGISGWIGVVCSALFVLPMYAALITLGLEHKELWLIAAMLGLIEFIETLNPFAIW